MGHFFSVAFQLIRRQAFLLVIVVLILISGKFIQGQWIHVQRMVEELPALRASLTDAENFQAAAERQITTQITGLSGATTAQLDARIRILDSEIRSLQQEQGTVSLPSVVLKGPDWLVQSLKDKAIRGINIELRRQAKDRLTALRTYLVVIIDRQAAVTRLEQLRLNHVQVYNALRSKERQLDTMQPDSWLFQLKILLPKFDQEAEKLSKDIQTLRVANSLAHKAYQAHNKALRPLPEKLGKFQVNEARLAPIISPLRERLRETESLAAQSWLLRAYQEVLLVLPFAVAVLIGWLLLPALVRSLLYFVLAPFAARGPPIVIDTTKAMAPGFIRRTDRDGTSISAQSTTITLGPAHELLIRPAYCQSQPTGIDVTTKVLFNWHMWLTSIAAHLWMLTRLRTSRPVDIVISSTVDALDEVAVLELAPGEAMVLQPRGLVGMIYQVGQSPVIRSHWRLGTLHAWLTFQFRYLVFEGPATLIVKGCRGVRLETALTGRTISQNATLGFSANAIYGTVRAEPFMPYLSGGQSLFNDKFEGQNACYLYEEVPRNARSGENRRNPLEVFFDASLKAFGI